MIKRKLGKLNLKAEQEKLESIVKQKIENPNVLVDVAHAKEFRTFTVDPSYVLEQDIYLPDNKLLYAKGERVNPLEHIDWQQKLIFIDGKNLAQVEWVFKEYLLKQNTDELKIILVSGSPNTIADQLKTQVYFDQFGELITKFKIENVPALVEREGFKLRISEFEVKS